MKAAEKLREYPSKSSAIALVLFINKTDKTTRKGNELAKEALVSLCLMTGEDFGTNFEGNPYNFSWSPPSADSWDRAVYLINNWAFSKFGTFSD